MDIDLLFIHIPKNAGCTIKRSLHLSGRDQVIHKRMPGRGISELLQQEQYLNKFKFAFVRNPWSRHVSNYHFFRNMTESHPFWRYDHRTAMEIKQFKNFEDFCYNFKNKHNKFHFQPQHVWACAPDGEIVLDYVGKVETIDSDMNTLCELLDRPSIKLGMSNTSQHGSYREYYTNQDTIDRVTSMYSADIQLFNYSFL